MEKEFKPSISFILFLQTVDNLRQVYEKPNVINEIKICMNIQLLLGLILEGVINEISYHTLDSWTYKRFEMSSTPLKWKLMSGIQNGFAPGKEPLQTIDKLHSIRNNIAHPKPFGMDDLAIAELPDQSIKKGSYPFKDWNVPEGVSINYYHGYNNLYDHYNFSSTKDLMLRTLSAIKAIVTQLNLTISYYDWVDEEKFKVEHITVCKRKEI